MPDPLSQQVEAAGALRDPVRRALYLYVAGQGEAVGRERAASAAGVSRVLAGFHLDRLVKAGLLESTFRRLTGRRGPGAGRPAKLYQRSARQFEISLPPRHYDLTAELFARALEDGGARPARESLAAIARAFGRSIGREGLRRRGASRRRPAAAVALLAAYGFEPRREGDQLELRNCPFDALARSHRDLVCGTSLALLQGMLEGLDARGVSARIEPRPGRCCVVLRGLAPADAGNVIDEPPGRATR